MINLSEQIDMGADREFRGVIQKQCGRCSIKNINYDGCCLLCKNNRIWSVHVLVLHQDSLACMADLITRDLTDFDSIMTQTFTWMNCS